MKATKVLFVPFLLIGFLVLTEALFIVSETDQIILTQFGKPVGKPYVKPGLHYKIPFIQRVNRFEKRFLEWDGAPNQIPTRDKRFIWVDTTARWQIKDPLLFFQRLRDERGAQSRLDDILDGETRNTIAKHNLIELVRTSNRTLNLQPTDEEIPNEAPTSAEENEPPNQDSAETSTDEETEETHEVSEEVISENIESGRDLLAEQVQEAAREALKDLGIEVHDFRFKRINYQEAVRQEVYTRMISERNRIAEEYRSEGQGEAARINGERERQLKVITSEAYRQAKEVKGRADAKAADIYAEAYNRNPEFYGFLKSMELYPDALDANSQIIMGTDSPFLKYLGTIR
ncbi:MAG: protease modulator HflC [Myxococcota bacterium]|nr:protease modulator HflC [Myxococcota bacterium]